MNEYVIKKTYLFWIIHCLIAKEDIKAAIISEFNIYA